MTGIVPLDLPGIWQAGTQIASAGQRNKLFEFQLAQMKGKQKALSTLQGGPDPTTGITWDTGRPGLGGDQQLNLLTQAFPEEMAKAQIAALIPDPDKRYKTTEHGYFDLRAPGGPKWVPNNNGAWAPWNAQGGAAAPAPPPSDRARGPTDTPAAPPAGSKLFSVVPGAKGVDLDATDRATLAWETGGTDNPATAQNPESSAFGPRQFVKSTWIDMLRRHAPGVIETTLGPNADLNAPGNQSRLHALRGDDILTKQIGAEYAKENAAILNSAGIEVTPRNLVVSHFLGGEGGKRFLSANPNMLGIQAAGPEAVKANHNVFYDKQTGKPRTVGEILAYVDQRIAPALQGQAAGGTAVAAAAPGAAAPPAQTPVTEEDLTPAIEPMTGKVSTEFGLDRNGQLRRWPARPSATTTVNVGEKAGEKAGVEARVKRFNGIVDDGVSASKLMNKLTLLQDRLKDVHTQGPGAENLYRLASTLEGLGVPRETIQEWMKTIGTDLGNPAAAANVMKLTNDFVATAIKGMGSNPTDYDASVIMQTVPGINNLAEANAYLIDNVLRPDLQSRIDLWKAASTEEAKDPTLAGLNRLMLEHSNKTATKPPPPRPPDTPPDTPPPPPPEQRAITGDPPPDGAVKPDPAAIWSNRIGGWVKRDPAWKPGMPGNGWLGL